MFKLSNQNERFWANEAKQLKWIKPFEEIFSQTENGVRWFSGGTLNASQLCLDAQISAGRGDQKAIIWESETGDQRALTYTELLAEVNRWAATLLRLEIKKGDIVTLYMPIIPEAVAAMLACARIGAIHSVVFAGFSPEALRERIEDTKSKLVVTSNISNRRGKQINLLKSVEQAVEGLDFVQNVLVFDRDGSVVPAGKVVSFSSVCEGLASTNIKPAGIDANDPLFILYTSGTTGKPKGIVHATGGYLVHNYSVFKQAFNPEQDSIYWCTADIGWITGHSYVVYAPLMHGVTVFIHEGTPNYPDKKIWYDLIKKYAINIFYTSPTAIRMLKKFSDDLGGELELPSLKVLGSVGEPINPSAWEWFFEVIGNKNCPIIDTWWQTETGGFIIAPKARDGINRNKPGSATKPLEGFSASILDEGGQPAKAGQKGCLVIDQPWPGMARTIYHDQKRFEETYFRKFPGAYLTGDFAIKDSDGDFWILGRSDDVIKVAGHRISSPEIESAVNSIGEVAESAAVGVFDETKGEKIVVFVTKKPGTNSNNQAIAEQVRASVIENIGKLAQISDVLFLETLPKTRSGKIMRRLLRAAISGESLGDISTLEEKIPAAKLDELKAQLQAS